MANLLKECPFPVDRTLFGSRADCSKEVLPYKNLDDITTFLHFITSGKEFPWLDLVKELQPGTEYCYDNAATVTDERWLPKRRLDRDSVPKTLICHDYKGNYLDDRLIYGSTKHESYNFYNWACIDIFVYFSHNFVTVPPPSWINAAHTHGVYILGTLITEEINAVWNTILESDTKMQWFADVLSLIAAIHKFDGYLLNVETKINKDLVPKLISFIEMLKQNLKERKHSKTYVIWYDAVTITGEVLYQNELTNQNKSFFDVCDGIFLNYNWSDKMLERSKELAGERLHDVFVGVDVFIRGPKHKAPGGGFKTDEALQRVRDKDLSAAIFAPGWTEEAIPGDFKINDIIFWSKIWKYFYVHGTKKLPFRTDFNRGFGLKEFRQGEIINENPWFNISRQNYQFLMLHAQYDMESDVVREIIDKFNKDSKKITLAEEVKELYKRLDRPVLEYKMDVGFNGGGCLKINPSSVGESKKKLYVPIFLCDLKVTRDWSVSVATKRIFGGNLLTSNKYPFLYVIVQTDEKILVKKDLHDSINVSNYYRGLSTMGEYYSGYTSYEWVLRKYLVSEKGRILEVGICISPDDSELYLGQIEITEW